MLHFRRVGQGFEYTHIISFYILAKPNKANITTILHKYIANQKFMFIDFSVFSSLNLTLQIKCDSDHFPAPFPGAKNIFHVKSENKIFTCE